MVAKKEIKKAMACGSTIRSSTRKLNLVAASIRGMEVGKALTQLSFSPRRVAGEVKKYYSRRLLMLKTITTWTLIN